MSSLRREPIRDVPQTYVSVGQSESATWEIATRAPHPRLRAFMLGYVGLNSRVELVREKHLPSGEAELLINFGGGYRVLDPAAPSGWTFHQSATVIGVHDRHVITAGTGDQHVLVARFTPMGAHLFLDVPMHELANRLVALDQLDSGVARLIPAQLHETADWAIRFAIMDSLIARRIGEPHRSALRVWRAWEKILEAGGLLSIRSLADELGCSHRHLIAQFRDYVGVAPKAVARVVRFNRVLEHFERGGSLHWARIAQDCGYYDQAHFIRDFREFAGSAPSDLEAARVGPSFRAD